MHTVIETPAYLAAAKDAGISSEERQVAIDLVADNPRAGDLMQGTGGCRKVRVPRAGKGKSGGYRVITAFGGNDVPVFLLTVFAKGEKANLTKAERNLLAKMTRTLFTSYRQNLTLTG